MIAQGAQHMKGRPDATAWAGKKAEELEAMRASLRSKNPVWGFNKRLKRVFWVFKSLRVPRV